MMKSTKVVLYKWPDTNDAVSDSYDIDWPAVQKLCGRECVEWLLKQPKDACQLVLELIPAGGRQLVAEFYNDRTAVSYHMMWAK